MIAAATGLAIPVAQPMDLARGPWKVVFLIWLTGPVLAGAILRSPRWLPALAPALTWFLMLPVGMLSGLMAPIGCPDCGPFRPEIAVAYLFAGSPVFVGIAWMAAYAAGRSVRRVRPPAPARSLTRSDGSGLGEHP